MKSNKNQNINSNNNGKGNEMLDSFGFIIDNKQENNKLILQINCLMIKFCFK